MISEFKSCKLRYKLPGLTAGFKTRLEFASCGVHHQDSHVCLVGSAINEETLSSSTQCHLCHFSARKTPLFYPSSLFWTRIMQFTALGLQSLFRRSVSQPATYGSESMSRNCRKNKQIYTIFFPRQTPFASACTFVVLNLFNYLTV
jgi:hypothetical protein